MSAMSEQEVVAALADAGVIPVATVETPRHALGAAEALRRGGISCIEITFRTAAAERAIATAREIEGMTVGAGTVLSVQQARAAAAAGAQFAVAPGSNPAVIDACAELELPFFPGVATPSEIEAARAAGRFTMKVFPAAQLGGPAFVRAVSATYRDVRFIPTGGVTPETFAAYLTLDSVIAVGSSWLVNGALIEAGRYDEIERLARVARETAQAAVPA